MKGENDLPAPTDKGESFGRPSGAGSAGSDIDPGLGPRIGEPIEALFAERDIASPSVRSTEARRHFLMRIGALAAVSGLGVLAAPQAIADEPLPGEPVTADTRYGLFVDADRCARGCDACVRACNEEHGLEPVHGVATDPQWIRKVTLQDRRSGRISTFPLMCQHCEQPPCVDVCPTGASFKRADGIVLVDKHICIGCRYCVMACPFQARSFVHEEVTNPRPWSPRGKGTVESCNFCVHRLDGSRPSRGALPACVEACDMKGYRALVFGDLNDPLDPVVRALAERGGQGLRPDLALDTKVLYRGV